MRSESCAFIWQPNVVTQYLLDIRSQSLGGACVRKKIAAPRVGLSVPSRLAAVDVQGLARDEGGLFQVEDPVDDVADLA